MMTSAVEQTALMDVERDWWRRLACLITITLPSERILHVGADEPALVEELVARGIDAFGWRVTRHERTSHVDPRRFTQPTSLEAERQKPGFSTVIWSLSAVGDLDIAIDDMVATLRQLCERHVIIVLDRRRIGASPIAVLRRVQGRFLAGGFRQHPSQFAFRAYDELLNHANALLLVFERVPQGALLERGARPSSAVDGFDDFLLDEQRTADDRGVRYALAAQLIRRLDVAVDVACGAGSGSATLYDVGTLCSRLLAVDARASAIEYARDAYGPHRPRLEFVHGDPETLAPVPDHAADVIVALDPEWVHQRGDDFLRHVERALLPSGRLIAAVPASQTEEPDASTFMRALKRTLRIEHVFAQFARRDDSGDPARRGLVKLESLADAHAIAADWWIVVALKDPVTHQTPRPEQIDHPRTHDRSLDMAQLSADYANPWVAYGLVRFDTRPGDAELLIELALRTLAQHPGYSTDRGAALAVLAYRRLEGDKSTALTALPLEAWLDDFVRVPPRGVLELRWCISNSYVLARLLLRRGDLLDAEQAFARCADLEPLAHEMLLKTGVASCALIGTKTVDAAFWAGWLAARRGAVDLARQRWKAGIAAAGRAVIDGWDAYRGPRIIPRPYGLYEASQILDAAQRCEQGLAWTDLDDRRVGDLALLTLRDGDYSPPTLHVSPATYHHRTHQRMQAEATEAMLLRRDEELAGLLLSHVSSRPLYVWGAGALGRRFAALGAGRFERVTAVIDGNPAKQGTTFEGKPIVAPTAIGHTSGAHRPFIIVTSQFADEIAATLEGLGYVAPEDVFVFSAQSG